MHPHVRSGDFLAVFEICIFQWLKKVALLSSCSLFLIRQTPDFLEQLTVDHWEHIDQFRLCNDTLGKEMEDFDDLIEALFEAFVVAFELLHKPWP
jgi:hypothetical protein